MSEPLDPDALVMARPNLPDSAPRRSISPLKTAFLIALPVLMLGYVYVAASGTQAVAKYEKAKPKPVADAGPNGAALYLEHCARCHGERGTADGPTSLHLNPWARKFGEDKFQLATTTNGIPSDDDLRWVIHRGIPGTAMPSFETLSDAEKDALVQHVRVLTAAGTYRRLYARAAKDDDIEIPRIVNDVEAQVRPGKPHPLPDSFPEPTPESIARGKKTYLANCATCHGQTGAGDGPGVVGMKNDNGQPTFPRDLARGVFKGGGEPHRLFLRLSLGMPGTPMPASQTLKPEEVADIMNFVKSLSAKRQAATGG